MSVDADTYVCAATATAAATATVDSLIGEVGVADKDELHRFHANFLDSLKETRMTGVLFVINK